MITYLVTDALGSVRGTVSSSGSLTATTTYDAWGNPLSSGGLTATTPFGFAGGYTDADGLIYLQNRYYQPQLGQFVSLDPDVLSTGQPYAYANGDPVVENDPNGLAAAVQVRAQDAGGVCTIDIGNLSVIPIQNVLEFIWHTSQSCNGPYGEQKQQTQIWRTSYRGWVGYGGISYTPFTGKDFATYSWHLMCNRPKSGGEYNYRAVMKGYATNIGWSGYAGSKNEPRERCGPSPDPPSAAPRYRGEKP
jgi:RHS repeat-associated protein